MTRYKVKICNEEVEIRRTRAVAIKAYCLDCSAGSRGEVKLCSCTMCPLYIYRGYFKEVKKDLTEKEKIRLRSMGFKKRKIS